MNPMDTLLRRTRDFSESITSRIEIFSRIVPQRSAGRRKVSSPHPHSLPASQPRRTSQKRISCRLQGLPQYNQPHRLLHGRREIQLQHILLVHPSGDAWKGSG